MIAEIRGKVSSTNSNLSERLEDELTGNFFGNMRYLSFNNGLKKILMNSVFPQELSKVIETLDADNWENNIDFWPVEKECEIDLRLNFENVVVGIEVKFKSQLSSDDDLDFMLLASDGSESDIFEKDAIKEVKKSRQQLARESEMLNRWGKKKEKVLLLLADESSAHTIYLETINRKSKIINPSVKLGYLTWQKVLENLKKITKVEKFDDVIVGDLIDLLIKKGFETFTGFDVFSHTVSSLFWDFNKENVGYFEFRFSRKIQGDQYYEFVRKPI